MSREEEENRPSTKAAIINYAGNFVDKRDAELRASTGDLSDTSVTHEVNRDSFVIRAGDEDYRYDNAVSNSRPCCQSTPRLRLGQPAVRVDGHRCR